jgi:guanylate kinase
MSATTTSSKAADSPERADGASTQRRGILFIISAPSGTGKTTLCKQLIAKIPNLWHSISYTTRKPRSGEEHGREYFFVEESVFRHMIERDDFAEWASVYGHFYGTPRKVLADKLAQGIDVLLEIDVQGAMQVKKEFADAVLIFILPPSMAELRSRLQTRASDAPEEIQRRLHQVKEEVGQYREYAYIVRNDEFARSLLDLEHIFLAERLKTDRMDVAWIENNFVLHDKHQPGDRQDSP